MLRPVRGRNRLRRANEIATQIATSTTTTHAAPSMAARIPTAIV